MKYRYSICCSAVFILIVLIITGCSNIKNNKKAHHKGNEYIRLIDMYRIELAYQIHKNWVDPRQSKSIDPKNIAAIKFIILPDGIIKDINFTKKSGNDLLDKAAVEAIMRTNPFKPHPNKVSEAYIEMGLRFGPEGVK